MPTYDGAKKLIDAHENQGQAVLVVGLVAHADNDDMLSGRRERESYCG
jgi:hypothetical protein